MNRLRVGVVIAVSLAFVAGAVCGGVVVRRRGWQRWDPEKRRAQLMRTFKEKLELTDQQSAQVGRILETSHQRMRSLHDQVRPQFEALRKDTSQQIRALLTSPQAEEFDDMEARFAKRWEERRRHWQETDAPSGEQEELR